MEAKENHKLNPWFVTGFCDGEAAFTYSRSRGQTSVYFAVRQTIENARVVEEIRDFFDGVGKIYYGRESLPKRYSGHTKPSIYYRVSRIDELQRILAHFEKYPLQSKKNDVFVVWKKLVEYKLNNFGCVDRGQVDMFLSKISALNPKSRKREYVKDNSCL